MPLLIFFYDHKIGQKWCSDDNVAVGVVQKSLTLSNFGWQ